MTRWINTTPKNDCVTTYTSEDGFYKITKRGGIWTLKRISLFNILGEEIGRFDSLEEAQNYLG